MEKLPAQEQAPAQDDGKVQSENPRNPASEKKTTSAKSKKAAAAAAASVKDGAETGDTGNETHSLKARKRTKTGCLTCRKRRIKCGEERPTCSNCVKSKRNCEGYTPRVVFKDPLSAYRPAVGVTHSNGALFQSAANQSGSNGSILRAQPGSTNQAALPPIAPRPCPPVQHNGAGQAPPVVTPGPSMEQYGLFGYTFDGQTYGQTFSEPSRPLHMHPNLEQQRSQFDDNIGTVEAEDPSRNRFGSIQQPKLHHRNTGESDSGIDMTFTGYSSHSSTSSSGLPATHFVHQAQEVSPTSIEPLSQRSVNPLPQALFPPNIEQASPEQWSNTHHETYPKWQWPSQPPRTENHFLPTEGHVPLTDLSPTKFNGLPNSFQGRDGIDSQTQIKRPSNYAHAPLAEPSPSFNTQPLGLQQEQCVEDPEDDYWDVSSDDETSANNGHDTVAQSHNLGLMIAVSANQHGKSFRSLTNFLNEPNVLATYRPTYAASPLRDPQTALVFCHFITATAPTISASERHIINTASMFSGLPVPKSQQGLWTYTMPMLALHHQGLMHAMLALASLHIAKLQKTSPTPSLKHYHYALRKVAKSLGNPAKRNDVATLAATLLLGFYEVTTAEHNKWNSHLAGAKQLIVETDFVNTANRIKAHKAQVEMAQKQQFFNGFVDDYGQSYPQQHPYYDLSESSNGLDENLISTLMGWKTSYNQYGQIIEGPEMPPPPSAKPVTQGDIEKFEAQCDLFWWYAKQDMYQSIISGNRLLLPYERWTHCPPRAPISRLDAVYGTMDHLILLMARIADFAGKDLPRKQKAYAKAQQMNIQTPANAGSYPSQTSIPGYVMPSDASYNPIPNTQSSQDIDLESSTTLAHNEWLSITRALDVFEESLGPSYAVLSPDHMTPLSTPFGPALYYRTYGIACIWSLYYTGRIIATRVHPSMPPAAMVAAGIAAPQTAAWANTIGRINAGLQPISTSVPLNPAHGAALMDSCMGTFHAGVQYRDAAQRGWTITKLRDVARLTGWQTSALIASGCERAWQKAYELGRGPKYERTMNKTAKDDRVAGRGRDADAGPPKDNNDRRFVKVNPGTRVYWAMGILSAEEDMSALSLD